MRAVVRNSFARQTIQAERVALSRHLQPIRPELRHACEWCGGVRVTKRGDTWLYRFHVDDDQGRRQSGPIAGGKLFCSRGCCESHTGRPFDEREGC